MFSEDLCGVNKTPVPYLGNQFRVIRFDIPQVDFSTTGLGDTIQDEPFCEYLLPGKKMRRKLLPLLFCSIARSSQLSGEIYTTEGIETGAVFFGRGDKFSFERLARAIISTARFTLGWPTFRRFVGLCARLDAAHKQLARGPHWYLMSLGMNPSKLGNSIATAMLQPLLSRADADGMPCYLETFRQTDLPLYENLGFRIEGAGRIPGGGPSFWAMLRLPQS